MRNRRFPFIINVCIHIWQSTKSSIIVAKDVWLVLITIVLCSAIPAQRQSIKSQLLIDILGQCSNWSNQSTKHYILLDRTVGASQVVYQSIYFSHRELKPYSCFFCHRKLPKLPLSMITVNVVVITVNDSVGCQKCNNCSLDNILIRSAVPIFLLVVWPRFLFHLQLS